MSTSQLVAVQTTEKPNKVRKSGYVPGIMYGKELSRNLKVKFKKTEIDNIIDRQGERARLNVVMDGKEYMAFIKEVQKDFVSYNNIHVDLQIVSSHDEIRARVPVVFEGVQELEFKRLFLEILVQNLEVQGNVEKIPERIMLDVSNMEAGKHITVSDLKLDKDIKVHNVNETIVVVCKMKEIIEAEPEKEKADESAAESAKN